MEAKVGATQTPAYDDFEPFCNWRHEDDRDTLVVHLPEFKKEQLKVNIITTGMLRITGERNVDATKRSRFYKELKTPKDCISNDIHARILNGLLYIVMPKKPAVVPGRKLTLQVQFQVDEDPKPSQDSSTSRYRNIAEVAMKATAAAAFISVFSALVVYVCKVYVCAE